MSDLAAAPVARVHHPAGWVLSLYPQAGEGGGCFVSSYRPERTYVARGSGADPKRAAEEAARRARSKVRRYCAANRLTRLGTLTYGPPRATDPAEVRAHVGLFFRTLRDELGGQPLPYVWVPEMHKDGVHFHVHFAVGRFVRDRLIRSVWGRGHVDIRLIGDLPVGSGALAEARCNAVTAVDHAEDLPGGDVDDRGHPRLEPPPPTGRGAEVAHRAVAVLIDPDALTPIHDPAA